jgi:hypothetical protein
MDLAVQSNSRRVHVLHSNAHPSGDYGLCFFLVSR